MIINALNGVLYNQNFITKHGVKDHDTKLPKNFLDITTATTNCNKIKANPYVLAIQEELRYLIKDKN